MCLGAEIWRIKTVPPVPCSLNEAADSGVHTAFPEVSVLKGRSRRDTLRSCQ
jgi:hypothetical protein